MHCHTLLQESMQAETFCGVTNFLVLNANPSKLKEAHCGDAEHSGVEEHKGTMQKAASACPRSKPLSVLRSYQTDAWVAQGNILTQPLNTCLST
jgi:hypothetical protein